jgi:hypothetical protein
VKAGVKADAPTTATAFAGAADQYKIELYGAKENAKAKREQVDKDFDAAYSAAQAEGASEEKLNELKTQHDAKIAEIEAEFASDQARVQAALLQNLNEFSRAFLAEPGASRRRSRARWRSGRRAGAAGRAQ